MAEVIQEPLITLAPPMRMHHLTGGLSLLVASNKLCTLLSPGGPGMSFFSLLTQASLSSLPEGHDGIRALGWTQFDRAEEMQDSVTSNFWITAPNVNSRCPAFTQSQYWSGVATALHGLNRDTDALLARRLNSQIRFCLTRLERLSIAYRTVLIAVKPKDDLSVEYTSDKYAHYIGSEYRSLLNELYGLRDALLVAVYRLGYKLTDPFTIKKLKALVTNETSEMGKLIARSMFSADGDLLIDHMSLYRSVAQHCIGTANPIFADMYRLSLSSGPYGKLPFLVYPLYDDIEQMRAIERGSSKGALERPSRMEAERFLSIPVHLDALEFCYDCFIRLLEICEVLGNEVAIEPEVIKITENEILELTLTDGLGNTKRLKREETTGQLVEY